MSLASCQTCLVSGRSLRSLGNLTHSYNALVVGLELQANVQLRRLDAMDEVCWECITIVRKILRFHHQVERARNYLDTAAPNITYSHLNQTTKLGFDYEIEYADIDICRVKSEIPEDVFVGVNLKQDSVDSDRFKDAFDDDDYVLKNIESDNLAVCAVESKTDVILAGTSSQRPKRKTKRKKKVKKQTGGATLHMARYTRTKMTEAEMWNYRALMLKQEPYASAQHKCVTCIKNFSRQYVLDKHNNDFHSEELGEYKCDICSVMLESEKAMLRHHANHFSLYACNECHFRCVHLHMIKSHVSLNHNDGQKYTCRRCGEVFDCTIKLKYHQKTHYVKKLCTCDYCGKQMPKFYLVKHIRIHTGQPTYSCELCGRVCRGEYTLQYHMRTKHGARPKQRNPEDVYCIECNIYFKSPAILQAHLQTTKRHAEHNLKFGCQFCQQKFLTAASVEFHVKRHHVEKKCEVCGIVLRSHYGYLRHVRLQHGDEKPVNCSICNKTLKHKRRMQEHMRTHTGERPYECSVCGDNFRQRAALYMHNKLKHREREINR